VADGSDATAAAAALRPSATAPLFPNEWDRLIEAPVIATDGLAAGVVRAR
jgi:hypothetical protein